MQLETIELTPGEVEALRHADLEGKNQEAAARAMQVSQPTLHRELKRARQKVVDALLNGKAITLGGETMPQKDGTGPDGKGPRTGRRMGSCQPEQGEESSPFWHGQRMRLGRGRRMGR